MGITLAIFQQLGYFPKDNDKFINRIRSKNIPLAHILSNLLPTLSKPRAFVISKLNIMFKTSYSLATINDSVKGEVDKTGTSEVLALTNIVWLTK